MKRNAKPKMRKSKSILAIAFALVSTTSFSGAQAQTATEGLGEKSASGQGIVVPARSWDLSAAAENQIDTIHFIEGQFVKEGDLLVTFDRVFKQWDARIAELDHQQAQSELELARADLIRKQRLSGNAVTEAQLLEAEIKVRIAEGNVETAELNAGKAKAISDLQLIHAPFDGQMSAPKFRDNANVVADSPEIGTIFQLDPIHVRVSGSYDRLLERLAQGMTEAEVLDSIVLALKLPDGSDYGHLGKMLTTSFSYDSETGLGTGIAEFPNPDLVLRPGIKVGVTSYDND